MNVDIASSVPMPEATERLLRELPEWFGIEDALQNYVASARQLPTYAAQHDRTTVGVCLVKRHSDHVAEIYLLAIARHLHRNGIGRALICWQPRSVTLEATGSVSLEGRGQVTVGGHGHDVGVGLRMVSSWSLL